MLNFLILMNMKTILEVKDHLRKHYESGTNCPACGQLVKAYKRKLNSNMCRALAIIYSRTKSAGIYIHVQNEFTLLGLRATAMDYTYLEKWKFIEANPDKSGHWRVTDKGKAFVEGFKPVKVKVAVVRSSFSVQVDVPTSLYCKS